MYLSYSEDISEGAAITTEAIAMPCQSAAITKNAVPQAIQLPDKLLGHTMLLSSGILSLGHQNGKNQLCMLFPVITQKNLLPALRSGGIQGGLSNGEDIVARIAFKPTSTISRKQHTVSRSGDEVRPFVHEHFPLFPHTSQGLVGLMVQWYHDDRIAQRALPQACMKE